MKVKDVQHGKTTRKSFARIEEILEMPNLIEVQKKSYEWFLDQGLREVFDDTASITDYTGNLELSFLDFSMDEEPKYSIEECKARDATYATPLKVRMRLRNKETGEIKEQEIFMGDFPKMTHAATFIINGAERAARPLRRPAGRKSAAGSAGRGPAAGICFPLSPRIFRRPAAAHWHCPGADRGAGIHRGR